MLSPYTFLVSRIVKTLDLVSSVIDFKLIDKTVFFPKFKEIKFAFVALRNLNIQYFGDFTLLSCRG